MFSLASPLVWGATPTDQRTPDLSSASLEELMNMPITSASRKEQRAIDVAAAVYVITRDDIRQSGLLTVPEVLRLAPGVQVARIDGNKWAVSVRGFNSRWSNKLLVMIDGRTVYTRLESGVAWDIVTPPLEDIDRIEIVRGPGGSVWGANAVDGVINILTSPATATQGGTLRATGGMPGTGDVLAEYGGQIGRAAVRAGTQASRRGESELPDSAGDGGDQVRDVSGHVRVDWTRAKDAVTVQGDVQDGRSGTRLPIGTDPIPPAGGWPPATWVATRRNANALARWRRTTADSSSLQIQSFIDYGSRVEPAQTYRATTFDVDLQYQTSRGRHEWIGGGAFRVIADRITSSEAFKVTPDATNLFVVNSFVQDEIRLRGDAVHAILGAKLEHDTFGGWGLQPSFRALWKISAQQRVWVAWSRAIRSPARFDRGLIGQYPSFIGPDGVPIVVTVNGNPDYQSEGMRSTEAGYRVTVSQHLSFDVSAFLSRHDRLVTLEPMAATLRFAGAQPYIDLQQQLANNLSADTRGAEATARWTPVTWLRLDGATSLFHLTPHPVAGTRDPDAATADGNSPTHQWRAGVAVSLGSRAEMASNVYGIGQLVARGVPAYTRLDAAFDWKLRPDLGVIVAGQNLAGAGHIEFLGADSAASQVLVTRTGTVRLTWRF